MKVKLNNGDIVEERRNGGKLKLTVADYIKILSLASAIILAGITGWFNLNAQVAANAKEVKKIASNSAVNIKQDKDILSIQGDIQYIKTDVADIKVKQDKANELLIEIISRLPR